MQLVDKGTGDAAPSAPSMARSHDGPRDAPPMRPPASAPMSAQTASRRYAVSILPIPYRGRIAPTRSAINTRADPPASTNWKPPQIRIKNLKHSHMGVSLSSSRMSRDRQVGEQLRAAASRSSRAGETPPASSWRAL